MARKYEIIYHKDTGELFNVSGKTVNYILKPWERRLTLVLAEIPNPLEHYKVDAGQIVRKNTDDIEKLDAFNRFDHRTFKTKLFGEFQNEIKDLAPYYSVIVEVIAYRNFKMLKDILGVLVLQGAVTQSIMGRIKTLLLNEGIDWDDYAGRPTTS